MKGLSRPSREVWPNFFIAGAPKAGTTSLYHYLRQHPQIFMSPVKEPYFFSRSGHHPIRDEQEYLKLFRKAAGYRAVGEARPIYLRDEDSPYRIRERIPNARIIAWLRDPVERAFSSYLMHVRSGKETRPLFYEALKASPFAENYISSSLYAGPIKRYFHVFGRERVLIVMFEELKTAPCVVTRRIAEFLGVDPGFVDGFEFKVHNPGGPPRGRVAVALLSMRSRLPIRELPLLPQGAKQFLRQRLLMRKEKPSMDTRAIEFLRPIFEPDIAELEQLLVRLLPELRRTW